jgi:PTH1 family peptidyl-tRNA hydrolase
MKPTTFMNESGRAVGEAVRFHKLDPRDVVILHDELDLAFGKIRVKTGGGHAGHNGLRDIDAHIGAEFSRVRLGIGHPGDKDQVHGHVLSDFAKADTPMLEKLIEAIAESAPMLIDPDQHNAFMSKVSQAIAPPKPKEPPPESKTPEGDDGV